MTEEKLTNIEKLINKIFEIYINNKDSLKDKFLTFNKLEFIVEESSYQYSLVCNINNDTSYLDIYDESSVNDIEEIDLIALSKEKEINTLLNELVNGNLALVSIEERFPTELKLDDKLYENLEKIFTNKREKKHKM